jgi:signal transduction histidine kinase
MDEHLTPLEGGDLLRFVYTCPLALLLTDSEGTIRLLNGAATSLLMPFACDGELDNLLELIETSAPEIRDFLAANGSKLKSNQLVKRVAMQTALSDRSFHLSFNFGRFDDGYSVTVQDVTDLVAREEENKDLLARESHERGRVEVASGILHDLGNALTGIAVRAVDIRGRLKDDSIIKNIERLSGFLRPKTAELDSILGSGKGHALLAMLEAMQTGMGQSRKEIEDGMEKMLAFIEHAQELITINRAFAGSGSDPAKGSSDLSKIMDDLLMMMSESVRGHRGRMEINVDRSLPDIAIDRSRLMQVLINLVKNATEAFATIDDPTEGLLLRIEACRNDQGELKITLSDNGPGFSEETAANFFQHGYSTKDRGTGEGLSGCQRIIAAFGGEIKLESDGPGCGATATILLPQEVFSNVD